MPSADEIRGLIQSYLKFMCDTDIDGIVDLYAEDATVEDPVGGAVQRGHDEIRAFYAGAAPQLQVELTGPIRVAGKECALPMLAEFAAGGKSLFIDVIDVMEFDEAGKIVSMRAFWNPAETRPTR